MSTVDLAVATMTLLAASVTLLRSGLIPLPVRRRTQRR
jgi:hypothetical protein